jgi:hypothetical protein
LNKIAWENSRILGKRRGEYLPGRQQNFELTRLIRRTAEYWTKEEQNIAQKDSRISSSGLAEDDRKTVEYWTKANRLLDRSPEPRTIVDRKAAEY